MTDVYERLAAQPADEKRLRNRLIIEQGLGIREATKRARQVLSGRPAAGPSRKVITEAVATALAADRAGRRARKAAKRTAARRVAETAAVSAARETAARLTPGAITEALPGLDNGEGASAAGLVMATRPSSPRATETAPAAPGGAVMSMDPGELAEAAAAEFAAEPSPFYQPPSERPRAPFWKEPTSAY